MESAQVSGKVRRSLEEPVCHGSLILVNRALAGRRRKRHSDRHSRYSWFDRGLASNNHLVEAVEIIDGVNQRKSIYCGELEQQQISRASRPIGRRAVHRAYMMKSHGTRRSNQLDGRREIDRTLNRVDRSTEEAVRVVVLDRTAVASGQHAQRPIARINVVEHDPDCDQIIIGVRIKRPVLMPLDC